MKPQDDFSYDPTGLADPFRARAMKPIKGGGGMAPDLMRPRGPLEAFPLDALRMVGTLDKSGEHYALVKTPDHTLYRVKKGDYMGLNYGLVLAVHDTSIEIRETIEDGTGNWAASMATVSLQE